MSLVVHTHSHMYTHGQEKLLYLSFMKYITEGIYRRSNISSVFHTLTHTLTETTLSRTVLLLAPILYTTTGTVHNHVV